jgi:hypothetical protein
MTFELQEKPLDNLLLRRDQGIICLDQDADLGTTGQLKIPTRPFFP